MTEPTHAVLGAGQTGANAVVAMREAGFAGRIVLIGEELHHPYERPPLSKAALTEDPAPAPAWVVAPPRYEALNVDLRLGSKAVALDAGAKTITLADGGRVAFDKLLFATGRLRPLLVPGARVVCIGAGVIGLETAASARQRGCEVTVLEMAATALGRGFTAEMARWVVRLHQRHGVALHFGVRLAAIEPDAVTLADGSRFPADVVVAGIGMVRNTELAQAAADRTAGQALIKARIK